MTLCAERQRVTSRFTFEVGDAIRRSQPGPGGFNVVYEIVGGGPHPSSGRPAFRVLAINGARAGQHDWIAESSANRWMRPA